ncbi:hypothetical protein Ndes2437A_g02409 [Nannochloris sp. 'desiccata']
MADRKGSKPRDAYNKRPSNLAAADGRQPFKKTRTDNSFKPNHNAEQSTVRLSKKERKELSRERKSRTNKNFNLIQEVVGMWETLRRHDTPAARRSEIASQILKKIDGRVAELANSHSSSRVVQAVVKHGTAAEREKVLKQLEPTLVTLSKSPYGRFVVSKLIDLASKDDLEVFIKAFKGRAPELLRHPAGTHVLDDLYTSASAVQRNAMAAEFYGREYSLFGGDGTLNNTQGAPATLHSLLTAVEPAKRRSIIQHLASAISPVIEKGLVDCQLAHRLIAEYLTEAPASLVADAVESLSGDALLHMLHTHQGCAAACMVLAYGTAKDRKKGVRALKGHVSAAVQDDWGHLAIMTALSVVDDTAMLKKFVVTDIQKDLGDFVGHKAAHRVFLQLLNPDCPRYLPPSLTDLMHPAEKILTQAGGAGKSKKEEEEEEAKDAEKNDSEDEDEEEGVGAAQKLSAGPLGVSKKDPFLRRKELLDGGLGQVLVTLCAESGADLIVAQHAGDVVGEVCRGGNDGVLEAVVGADAIDAVHDAIVEAAANTLEEENSGVLGSYFGSRVVRRLVLSSTEEGLAGKIAQRFTQALWEKALKGKCKKLRVSHAAKVLAAVVHSGMKLAVRPSGVAMARPIAARALPHKRSTVSASAQTTNNTNKSGGAQSHLVATLLVQKEEELRQLTAPGKLPPRASVVAAYRKEIADLRAQLKSTVAANLPPTLAADLPLPPPFPSPSAAAAAAAIGSAVSQRASASSTIPSPAMLSSSPNGTASRKKSAAAGGIAAREALVLVEQQLSFAGSGSGNDSDEDLGAKARTALYAVEQSLSMGVVSISKAAETDELAEYEALQQENELLKQRLEALQEYQRKLDFLKEQAERMSKQAAEEKKTKKQSEPAATPGDAAPVVEKEKKKRAPRKTATKKAAAEGEEKTPTSSSDIESKPKVKRTTRKKAGGASSSDEGEGVAGEAAIEVSRKRATKKAVSASTAAEEEKEAALQNIVNVFL